MRLLTGDEFFPGGLGKFIAKKQEFLVFEDGPSVDMTLEWATYRDASDQCSLSRIWGGIDPPADDVSGRLIVKKLELLPSNMQNIILWDTNNNTTADYEWKVLHERFVHYNGQGFPPYFSNSQNQKIRTIMNSDKINYYE